MGDMGDYFRDWNQHFKDIRSNCLETRLEFLKQSDLNYEILSLNAGHVRITTNDSRYDVWLGTGKWTKVGSNKYHQNWTDLLKVIKKGRVKKL